MKASGCKRPSRAIESLRQRRTSRISDKDQLGKYEDAQWSIAEAIRLLEATRERWCEAEVHRVAGEIALLIAEPDPVRADACFKRAPAVARAQQARSWELRGH